MIQIEPTECLMDELVSIRVSGLRPGQHITIRCETWEQKFVYDSYAHFIASLEGEVDCTRDPSFGGCYRGVNAMGIFAHMLPAVGQMKGLRYFPRRCMSAMEFQLQVYAGHLDDENKFTKNPLLKQGGDDTTGIVVSPLTEGVVFRRCNGEGVTRHEVRHGRVRGTIFQPAGAGPFKGVIDVYGGAGGINESRVAMLASRGFIAFTLPHHLHDDLPQRIEDLEVEYFLEAIHYFTSLPTVQPGGVGMLAVCGGGAVAVFLSTICPKISAFGLFGSPYTLTFRIKFNGEHVTNEMIQHIAGARPLIKFDEHGGAYTDEWNLHVPEDRYATEIEKSDAAFLVVAGTDDKSMHAVAAGQYMVNRMRKHGKGDRITLLAYPGAGHFIDPPYMPKTLVQYMPAHKRCSAVGGEPVAISCASEHCWKETINFLNKNVGLSSKI